MRIATEWQKHRIQTLVMINVWRLWLFLGLGAIILSDFCLPGGTTLFSPVMKSTNTKLSILIQQR